MVEPPRDTEVLMPFFCSLNRANPRIAIWIFLLLPEMQIACSQRFRGFQVYETLDSAGITEEWSSSALGRIPGRFRYFLDTLESTPPY